MLLNTLSQRTLYISGEEMQPVRDVFAELTSSPDVRKHLIGMVTGLDIRYDVGPGDHALLGRRLPGLDLVGHGDSGKTTTHELLHTAQGVLLDLAGDGEAMRVAQPWSDRVRPAGARALPDGTGDPLAGADALLVRPDGYVAWAGHGGSGTAGLVASLTRWFGEPASGSRFSAQES